MSYGSPSGLPQIKRYVLLEPAREKGAKPCSAATISVGT
jgi:hypothetical protein